MKIIILSFFFVVTTGFFLSPTMGFASPNDQSSGNPEIFFYSGTIPTEFIVVEKRHQKLSVFEHRDTVKLLKEFTCATGQNAGTKRISGDSRTPEGIYFITEVYEDKRITVFGSRAFHLDYPNIFDTHAGHNGDGIFIHGTNKKLIPNSTNGCITLNNTDLDELAPHLTINEIPIIVVDALTEPLIDKDFRLEPNSPQFHEIIGSLSFDLKKVPVRDIQTLSFLNLGNKAVISIKYSTYENELIEYREKVRTYLTQSLTGAWRSVYAVQSQERTPFLSALHPIKNDLVTKIDPVAPTLPPLQTPEQPPETGQLSQKPQKIQVAQTAKKTLPVSQPPQLTRDQELLNFLEKWRSAWAAKDIEAYINCYSSSFKNGELDRNGWKAKKIQLNKKYSYINVALKDFTIKWTESGAHVSFYQTYKSDQYQTTGTKILQLSKRNNRWVIESEFM